MIVKIALQCSLRMRGCDELVDELRGMMGAVSFNLLGESRIVQISCERTEPELTAAVVNAYAEATVLRAGYAFEQATDWAHKRPDLSWAA